MESEQKAYPGAEGMSIVERVERIYTLIERIVHQDAQSLSASSKGNLRKARAELQRVRLMLLDENKTKDNNYEAS